jgi:DNA-binding response OmpR family regulator
MSRRPHADQNPPTLVIADNDESVTFALQTRLESLGYRCLIAHSGAQALALFNEGGVDLIVSDLNMPAGDGVTLGKTIRESSQVPIIFITGFHDAFKRSLRGIPNVTVIGKPFSSTALIDLVEMHLVLAGKQTRPAA